MPLSDLGFTDLQERVYLAILTEPSRDVAELTGALRCDDDSLQDAFEALAALGWSGRRQPARWSPSRRWPSAS